MFYKKFFKLLILYRVIINDCPIAVDVETHTNFRCAASLATLDKLVDRFPLLPGAPPIGDTSHSCYEAYGTFNYVTNAYCNGTIIYNDPVYTVKSFLS
jgi:hypothetical protein